MLSLHISTWIAMIMWNSLRNVSFLSKCMNNKALSLFQRKLIKTDYFAEIPHSYSHHQTCAKENSSGVENDLQIIKYITRWSIYVPIQEEAYESYCNHQLAEEYTVHLTNENEKMKNEKSQTFVTMRFMVLEAKKYKLMYRNYTEVVEPPHWTICHLNV